MSSLPGGFTHRYHRPEDGTRYCLKFPEAASLGLWVHSRVCSAAGSSAKPIPRGLPRGKFLPTTGRCMERSPVTPKALPPGTAPRQTGEAVPGVCPSRGNLHHPHGDRLILSLPAAQVPQSSLLNEIAICIIPYPPRTGCRLDITHSILQTIFFFSYSVLKKPAHKCFLPDITQD